MNKETKKRKAPSQLEGLKKRLKGMIFEQLVDEIFVLPPGMWDNDVSPLLEDWYAVSTDAGIIAYFGDENDADSFRSDLINSILNK